MFLHQQVHLHQWNSHVCDLLFTPAKRLGCLCPGRSNPKSQCSEECCYAVTTLTGSPSVTLLRVSWSVCNPFWCKGLLTWIPVRERCRAQTLSCTASDRNIKSCGRGSLNDFSRQFSAKSESSFECNQVEYAWKNLKELTVMQIAVLSTTKSSITFSFI